MTTLATPYADKLVDVDSGVILRAMKSNDWLCDTNNIRNLKDINGANEEMDQIGDIGLTLKFNEVKLLTTSEGIEDWFGATGEFYILTTVFDGSERQFEYKTSFFQGLQRRDRMPLGDGGMLVTYMKNPKWFIDIHMLVMESDSDKRNFGKYIQEAKKKTGLDDVLKFAGSLAVFDPTLVMQIKSGVDLFLNALSYILQNNGDDHVATIHDFYLKQQAFGKGRHPAAGMKRFQNVEAAYTIDLTKLEA